MSIPSCPRAGVSRRHFLSGAGLVGVALFIAPGVVASANVSSSPLTNEHRMVFVALLDAVSADGTTRLPASYIRGRVQAVEDDLQATPDFRQQAVRALLESVATGPTARSFANASPADRRTRLRTALAGTGEQRVSIQEAVSYAVCMVSPFGEPCDPIPKMVVA